MKMIADGKELIALISEIRSQYNCFDNADQKYYEALSMVLRILRHLPSAQPELIRCKDCKHYKAYEYTGKLACHYVIGGTVVRNLNDFCSQAEKENR